MRCHKMRRVLVGADPGRQPKLRDVSMKRQNDFETIILKDRENYKVPLLNGGKSTDRKHKSHPVTCSTLFVVWQTL